MKTYSLIIPIYNEERTLTKLLNTLHKIDKKNIEIIIVDDGSNDDTENILSQSEHFIILRNKINQGKGASIIKGAEFANNQNLILIDGDLEIEIEIIPKLIAAFEKNDEDVLVGIRWNNNSDYSYNINSFGNYFINGVFNFLYHQKLSDVLCCVRILNLELFKSLHIQSKGFSIEIETISKLVKKNLMIGEIMIDYNRRTQADGKKLKGSDGWGIIWTMIKIRFFYK